LNERALVGKKKKKKAEEERQANQGGKEGYGDTLVKCFAMNTGKPREKGGGEQRGRKRRGNKNLGPPYQNCPPQRWERLRFTGRARGHARTGPSSAKTKRSPRNQGMKDRGENRRRMYCSSTARGPAGKRGPAVRKPEAQNQRTSAIVINTCDGRRMEKKTYFSLEFLRTLQRL